MPSRSIAVAASPKDLDVMLMAGDEVAKFQTARCKLFGGQYTYHQALSQRSLDGGRSLFSARKRTSSSRKDGRLYRGDGVLGDRPHLSRSTSSRRIWASIVQFDPHFTDAWPEVSDPKRDRARGRTRIQEPALFYPLRRRSDSDLFHRELRRALRVRPDPSSDERNSGAEAGEGGRGGVNVRNRFS
jgi:hypothetical protein